MRKCLIGDLLEAAALVAAAPLPRQRALARQLLDQAHVAHCYAKRYGRAHPRWGNGSLMARALAESGPRTGFGAGHPGFLAGLAVMALALSEWKSRNAPPLSVGFAI